MVEAVSVYGVVFWDIACKPKVSIIIFANIFNICAVVKVYI